ncbi:hypothetical protein [Metabacillus sp. RGM 3146]|uniref:hypothetical protein n=1 Tax=Metabacillus sp. RGM 3146 TaxID=3401092 RepID=UPI003B9CCD55
MTIKKQSHLAGIVFMAVFAKIITFSYGFRTRLKISFVASFLKVLPMVVNRNIGSLATKFKKRAIEKKQLV